MIKLFTSCLLLTAATLQGSYAQTAAPPQPGSNPLPTLIEKNGRHLLYVDGKPFFLLGGQAHNSSAWPALLPGVWNAVEELNANTLEIPIYWEQIEPERDRFDFSLIDTLVGQARQHQVRLVLLWFATWKNGSNHYMPGWMKRQPATYPNCIGPAGQWVDSPSPIADATLEADKKAFAKVMRHLRGTDPVHTVIFIQVENEPGAWGTVRDFSPAAQKLFAGPVPAALLQPDILQQLGHPGNNGSGHPAGNDRSQTGNNGSGHPASNDRSQTGNNGSGHPASNDRSQTGSSQTPKAGSWQQVFGNDADEFFQAWSVARFIGQVAAAGKAEYPLPMYANAALRDPLTHPAAATYESGGPTDNVIPIWKTAAPAIDLVTPDIYLDGNDKISKVVELYARRDNPLLVPEAGLSTDKVKVLYEVLAQGGIGFSPFGIDDNGNPAANAENNHLTPFAQQYTLLSPLCSKLAQWSFEDRIRAAVEPNDHSPQTLDLGRWEAVVTFGTGRGYHMRPNPQSTGKAMIIRLGEDSFLATGTLCRIGFRPTGQNEGKAWQYLKVEEGRYENGSFVPRRILNGDETDWGGPAFGAAPVLLRVTVLTR